jgi:Mn-dependent DtxR family transcriptional regulator
MNLHESAEMYLETIYILSMRSQSVRSIDVAECMGYSKPSVSRAVNLLKQGGYLTMAQDGCLSLTQQGIDAAKNIFTRHNILTEFLEKIGVDKETASSDACKIEHVISQETINAIKEFINKI